MKTEKSRLLHSICERHRFCNVVVGFSGGPDSTALLLFLEEHSKALGFTVEAVHFQHFSRGEESLEDERWCRDFCLDRGIRCTCIALDPLRRMPGNIGNFEAIARQLRLRYYERLFADKMSRRNMRDAVVALGHQADDRVETFLLRAFRGGNASGLAAPRSVQPFRNFLVVRPLLEWTRSDILNYLEWSGIRDWRRDRSNDDDSHARNVLRNKLLPSLEKTGFFSVDGILRSAAALEIDADFLERSARDALEKLVSEDGSLEQTGFFELHDALKIRVLRRWLRVILGIDFIPNFRLIERIHSIQKGGAGDPFVKQYVPLNAKWFLEFRNRRIRVLSDIDSIPSAMDWNWRDDAEVTWGRFRFRAELRPDSEGIVTEALDDRLGIVRFDAASFPNPVRIRSPFPGDRIVPFGRHTAVKIKKVFCDRKVSEHDKATWPVFCDSRLSGQGEPILWIPKVRRSHVAPITENCTEQLEIRIIARSEADQS